ncbi:MAG: hypothetical protein K2L27_01525 [Muribaculaceae bacterium]|nr:hypothetical protein [Muribaculaceae bacterium]
MKIFKIAAAALLCSVMLPALSSCEEDEKYNPVLDESLKVGAPTLSVEQGAVVDLDLEAITITYAQPVSLNSAAPITLNDQPVAATVNADDRREVIVPLALTAGTSYVLNVSERAVAVIGTPWFAPEVSLNFSTAAKEIPSTDIEPLVNANAIAQAQNVHQFLVEEHGKHILSGAMANVNNNNDFPDWIYSLTGKYPAMVGYDFIHLPESGQNWINYDDITPATTQWENNGLVSYMWHWRVPTDEQAWRDKDYNRYGARVPGPNVEGPTDFDITRALEPGTWENEFILEDLDKVAVIFKKLEAAGIPVIWRPLHEAAGSYIYNNPWFWWGAKGGEATKQLWILMYDRLVNHNGVNNLIWVWTAQYDADHCAEMAADYPGNEYVDAVGVDVYATNDDSQVSAYSALVELTQGKKLVALTETGLVQNPDKCMADKAAWSWFNIWYTYNAHVDNPSVDEFGNTPESLRGVFDSEYVINREDMPSLK